jgi:hypothetical protein
MTMARASSPIARILARSEHSPLTINDYRSDLDAFVARSQSANGEPMEAAKITPTDLGQFKRRLVERRRLRPCSVNRKRAALENFLTRAAATDLVPGLPISARGRSWSGPRRRPEGQKGGDLQSGRTTHTIVPDQLDRT